MECINQKNELTNIKYRHQFSLFYIFNLDYIVIYLRITWHSESLFLSNVIGNLRNLIRRFDSVLGPTLTLQIGSGMTVKLAEITVKKLLQYRLLL